MQKYRNRIIAGLAIGFVIYLALGLLVNTEELVNNLRVYPWIFLLPVILLKFGSWFFRFLEWHYFLGVIDAQDKISVFDSAVLFISGFTMAVSPGKVAEVLKAVILKNKTGVPIARSAPVVVAERVVDGLAVLILAVLALLLAGDAIDLGEFRYMIVVSAALLLAGLVVVQIKPLAYFVLNRIIAYLPLVRRMHTALVIFYESSYDIFKLRHMIPTTGMGMIAALGDGLGLTIILAGFGAEITWILFLQALVIICLSSAIGALSGVPNGAGVTEVSVSVMLLAIVAPTQPAITPAVAATAALVEGFFHKWFRVFAGMLVAIIFRKRLFTSGVEAAIAEMEHEKAQRRGQYQAGSVGIR